MGWRGTVVLALIVAAAGACLWFEEIPAPQPTGPQTLLREPRRVDPAKSVRHLLDFSPDDTVAFRLESDRQTREITRAEGHWQGAPNTWVIDDFLKSLA